MKIAMKNKTAKFALEENQKAKVMSMQINVEWVQVSQSTIADEPKKEGDK